MNELLKTYSREDDNWMLFARHLFLLEDADPGYMALARAKVDEDTKKRFVVAWCSFYNPGIAAEAAVLRGKRFWAYLNAQYPTAKRASERRHFRGDAGRRALIEWERRWPNPERMIDDLQGKTYFDVRKKCADVTQIGDYFIWKLADIQSVVFNVPCDFRGSARFSPKVPRESAAKFWPLQHDINGVQGVYDAITNYLCAKAVFAPPFYQRTVGIQEAETVCCVFKQYKQGDYWYGSRTAKALGRLEHATGDMRDAMVEAYFKKSKAPFKWTFERAAQVREGRIVYDTLT